MKRVRVLLDLAVVASTALLVGAIYTAGLLDEERSYAVGFFLQVMHVSFIAAAVTNIVEQVKEREKGLIVLTALPLLLFLLALILRFFELRFPFALLVVFDLYLIIWFFFLFLRELKKQGQGPEGF